MKDLFERWHYQGIPTWLIVRASRPFLPATHPWKNRKFTLAEWSAGETNISRLFDLVLWWSLFVWMIVGTILCLRQL